MSFVGVWGDSKTYRRSHESGHYEWGFVSFIHL